MPSLGPNALKVSANAARCAMAAAGLLLVVRPVDELLPAVLPEPPAVVLEPPELLLPLVPEPPVPPLLAVPPPVEVLPVEPPEPLVVPLLGVLPALLADDGCGE